jgi:hypothetical protein
MQVINTLAPKFLPEIILASKTKLCMALVIKLVLFACSFAPFIFRCKIVDIPTLSTNLKGGVPKGGSMLKNSIGYRASTLLAHIALVTKKHSRIFFLVNKVSFIKIKKIELLK